MSALLRNVALYFDMFEHSMLDIGPAHDAQLRLREKTTSPTTSERLSFAQRASDLLIRRLVVVNRNASALRRLNGTLSKLGTIRHTFKSWHN